MCVRVIEWWKAINKEVFAKRCTHYVNVEENDRMIYACKACYGAFSYKDNRNGARTFPHCKKYFTNKKCMYNHVESINGTLKEVMQANMCSENCYDIRKALKSAETLPCPACDTAFQQRKALSQDSSCYIVRGWNAPRDVMCTRTYVTREVLDCHRKSHETVGEQMGNISDGVLFLASESALQKRILFTLTNIGGSYFGDWNVRLTTLLPSYITNRLPSIWVSTTLRSHATF